MHDSNATQPFEAMNRDPRGESLFSISLCLL